MVAINAIDDPCSRSSEFMVSLRFFKVFFREIDLNNTHLCIFCKLDPLINPKMKSNFASKIISNQNKSFFCLSGSFDKLRFMNWQKLQVFNIFEYDMLF